MYYRVWGYSADEIKWKSGFKHDADLCLFVETKLSKIHVSVYNRPT